MRQDGARIERTTKFAMTTCARHLEKNSGEMQSRGLGNGGTPHRPFVKYEYFIEKLEGSASELIPNAEADWQEFSADALF